MEQRTQISLWSMLPAADAACVRPALDGSASAAGEEPEAHVG